MTAYTYDDLYVINYTDTIKGTITIPKASVITDILDITLLGKTLLNYGEILDENVLHILENFACNQLVPPIDNVIEPDLSQTTDENPSSTPLLSNPTTGELWYNKTDNHLYVYNTDNVWQQVKLRGDIAANSGIVTHGEFIPLPAGITSYAQCSYFVSPQYIDADSNYLVCYADGNGLVYMRYRPTNSVNMVDGLANYIILGNIVTETHYVPVVSVTPTLTAAPVLTSTPTNTVTPTNTPVAASTVTPTISISPTTTVTITPTLTGTPVITPTRTAAPTPTPTRSSINYLTYNLTGGNTTANVPNVGVITLSGFFQANPIPSEFNIIGALTPGTYRGLEITQLGTIEDGYTVPILTFTIISPTYTPTLIQQNSFLQISFTDQFGIFRTYTSASAAFRYTSEGSGGIQWIWLWAAPSSLFASDVVYPILVYP